MIFGRCGMLMKVSRCNIAACSMKPAITPPWMAGRVGLPMLSLFAGRRKTMSSPRRRHSMPSSLAYGISSTSGL